MQQVSSGYTIVEVMIVLGVTIAIMAASMNLISGKQGETEFNQKMRDTQSKIQDWMNDVSTGNTGGDTTKQTCYASGASRPVVKNIAPTGTYDPECTFLGKAVQFTDINNTHVVADQPSSLYVYSVFGRRIASSTNQLPTNMNEAAPDAAVGTVGGGSSQTDLTAAFSLSPAHVKSVCAIPQGSSACGTSHLVGFMNSFNTEQNTAANGSEDLNFYLYNFDGNNGPADQGGGSRVWQCIQGQGSCSFATNPPSLKSFTACLDDGKHTAQIVITSTSGIGASVRLDYVAC